MFVAYSVVSVGVAAPSVFIEVPLALIVAFRSEIIQANKKAPFRGS
jgi:hypothetical protein